ncbi:hypothetical protein [Aureispira anguillae]|uniref:Uncharacterized protein n=1 Tax=Aureispira anguillae TaxID=2864201 RepID=A0A915YEW6_9BACT|nr:hypothetical protein [Aureispira anguillae]BDS11764.1 hypothetical protein AsAng_0024780 [Aureispira anguillae]
MSDKNYQELYLKARKVYEAATVAYKELVAHADVLEKDQLKAAKVAIEKAKKTCLLLQKKAKKDVTVKKQLPLKIAIVTTDTTPSGNSNPIVISDKDANFSIKVKFRIENMSCPKELNITDPCKIQERDQQFYLSIWQDGKLVNLSSQTKVKIVQTQVASENDNTINIVEYSAVITPPVPAGNASHQYTLKFNCKGINGIVAAPNIDYFTSKVGTTQPPKKEVIEGYELKINIDPPTPKNESIYFFDKTKKELGATEIPFKATIENIILPAKDNYVEIKLESENVRTGDTNEIINQQLVQTEKATPILDKNGKKTGQWKGKNVVTVTGTIQLDHTFEPREKHQVILSCKNEQGYVDFKQLTFITHGQLCYDIIITDEDYEPVTVENGIVVGYTAKRIITKKYYPQCNQGGNIIYYNVYEQNKGNLENKNLPQILGNGQGIPSRAKRPCDFTAARNHFSINLKATDFKVKPLVWLVNSTNTTTKNEKPTINTESKSLGRVQFNSGLASFINTGTATKAIRDAVAGRGGSFVRDTSPWTNSSTKQVVGPNGNTINIVTDQRTVVSTQVTIEVTVFTGARGWGGNPAIMSDRIEAIRKVVPNVTLTKSNRGRAVDGVAWLATDAEREGVKDNLVKFDLVTTVVRSIQTRTTVTIPPMGPECP